MQVELASIPCLPVTAVRPIVVKLKVVKPIVVKLIVSNSRHTILVKLIFV